MGMHSEWLLGEVLAERHFPIAALALAADIDT